MASSHKRVQIALTLENWRQLEELMKEFGETRSEVMKRSLSLLYYYETVGKYKND